MYGMFVCLRCFSGPPVLEPKQSELLVDFIWLSFLPIIPSITDELMKERGKYKAIADEMDQTFADLAGY
jgi:hypothetical protein